MILYAWMGAACATALMKAECKHMVLAGLTDERCRRSVAARRCLMMALNGSANVKMHSTQIKGKSKQMDIFSRYRLAVVGETGVILFLSRCARPLKKRSENDIQWNIRRDLWLRIQCNDTCDPYACACACAPWSCTRGRRCRAFHLAANVSAFAASRSFNV